MTLIIHKLGEIGSYFKTHKILMDGTNIFPISWDFKKIGQAFTKCIQYVILTYWLE